MPPVKNPSPPFRTVTPYLVVRGCAKAIEFYKKAFDAKELERNVGPDGVSIMHARLMIGDSLIMLNDEFPEAGGQSPKALEGSPVTLHIYTDDCDEMFKRAVAAGAKVEMEMQNTFWGDRYGQIVDPFGHNWSIATKLEEVSQAEKRKRVGEMLDQ
jgi:uncharacterized glyoxalase superfamily protein PhnB